MNRDLRRLLDLGVPFYLAKEQVSWEQRSRIIYALRHGARPEEIAARLGLSRSLIYQIKSEADLISAHKSPLLLWLTEPAVVQ